MKVDVTLYSMRLTKFSYKYFSAFGPHGSVKDYESFSLSSAGASSVGASSSAVASSASSAVASSAGASSAASFFC